MPTIEDILSDISAEIAQLSGDVTSIGSASTASAGLVKISDITTPADASVPTVAFLKNKNILGASGNAAGGLPQNQQAQINALPSAAILTALSNLPASLSGLAGRIIAVNATGNGYEVIVAPTGGGGGGGGTLSVSIIVDHFTGNGTATQFTLSQSPANSNAVIATVSGVTIDPALYSIAGAVLTFTDPPPITSANGIIVRHLGAVAAIADNSIPTAKIADRAVTLAKIANGTPGKFLKFNATTGVIEETDVVATVADNSISTIKLVNNAVTLPKMANGTPGKYLKFNSSTGVLEEVDIAAQVAAMNFIARYTISSSVVQLDVENAAMFDGTYKQLMIIGSGIIPPSPTATGHFYCRVKTGGSYRADGDYRSSGHDAPNNGGHNVYQDNSALLLVPQWSGSTSTMDFVTTITNPNAIALPRPVFMTTGNQTNNGGQTGNSTATGLYNSVSTLPLQGLRFFFSNANMGSGNIDCYGIK